MISAGARPNQTYPATILKSSWSPNGRTRRGLLDGEPAASTGQRFEIVGALDRVAAASGLNVLERATAPADPLGFVVGGAALLLAAASHTRCCGYFDHMGKHLLSGWLSTHSLAPCCAHFTSLLELRDSTNFFY